MLNFASSTTSWTIHTLRSRNICRKRGFVGLLQGGWCRHGVYNLSISRFGSTRNSPTVLKIRNGKILRSVNLQMPMQQQICRTMRKFLRDKISGGLIGAYPLARLGRLSLQRQRVMEWCANFKAWLMNLAQPLPSKGRPIQRPRIRDTQRPNSHPFHAIVR